MLRISPELHHDFHLRCLRVDRRCWRCADGLHLPLGYRHSHLHLVLGPDLGVCRLLGSCWGLRSGKLRRDMTQALLNLNAVKCNRLEDLCLSKHCMRVA